MGPHMAILSPVMLQSVRAAPAFHEEDLLEDPSTRRLHKLMAATPRPTQGPTQLSLHNSPWQLPYNTTPTDQAQDHFQGNTAPPNNREKAEAEKAKAAERRSKRIEQLRQMDLTDEEGCKSLIQRLVCGKHFKHCLDPHKDPCTWATCRRFHFSPEEVKQQGISEPTVRKFILMLK